MGTKIRKFLAPKARLGPDPVHGAKPTQVHRFAGEMGTALAWVLLALVISLTAGAPLAQLPPGASHRPGYQDPSDDNSQSNNSVPQPLTAAQRHSLMHANFVRSKKDAAELAALAKGLREALNKPNADITSVEVVSRAVKIERLAKKIREETTGF